MKAVDVLRLSWAGLSNRRLRAALTTLGISIGVAAIIALVSTTAGFRDAVLDTLMSLGPNSIFVISQNPREPLTSSDAYELTLLTNVEKVVPLYSTEALADGPRGETRLRLIGVSPEGLEDMLGSLRLRSGSLYPRPPSPVSVVGHKVADALGVGEGSQITVRGPGNRVITLYVSGVLDEYGAVGFINIDESIIVSDATVLFFLAKRGYDVLLVKSNDPVGTSEWLSRAYSGRATVISARRLADTISSISNGLSILLAGVAGISLFVAGISIMNIMLVSVLERRREIGIMKAIGFKDSHILLVFLGESLVIGVVGSVIGLALGVVLSSITPTLFSMILQPPGTPSDRPNPHMFFSEVEISPVMDPLTIIWSVAVALLVSVVSTLYPALKAARVDPVESIRYE